MILQSDNSGLQGISVGPRGDLIFMAVKKIEKPGKYKMQVKSEIAHYAKMPD